MIEENNRTEDKIEINWVPLKTIAGNWSIYSNWMWLNIIEKN